MPTRSFNKVKRLLHRAHVLAERYRALCQHCEIQFNDLKYEFYISLIEYADEDQAVNAALSNLGVLEEV